jgi:hypothetical protein
MGYFDQIMVSQSLIKTIFPLINTGKQEFTTSLLIQTAGQFKGYPKRHSATEIGFRITSLYIST